jgi:hypothetical protein
VGKAVDPKCARILRGLAEELAGIRADLEKLVESFKGTRT